MAAEFLFHLPTSRRRVVTLLRSKQSKDEGSFPEVGEWLPWRLDREGSLVCAVAAARFQRPRSTQPDQPLEVRVALMRDWRKLIVGKAAPDGQTDESGRWKADLAPDKQNFWEPAWQATPAPPESTRPKLIPVVTTAAEAAAVELARTYFRRWNSQEHASRAWLIPQSLGDEARLCERASGELGTGSTTDDLRKAPGSLPPTGRREPQAAPSDG